MHIENYFLIYILYIYMPTYIYKDISIILSTSVWCLFWRNFYNIPALRSYPTHHGIFKSFLIDYIFLPVDHHVLLHHSLNKQSFSHRGSHGILYKVYSIKSILEWDLTGSELLFLKDHSLQLLKIFPILSFVHNYYPLFPLVFYFQHSTQRIV